MGTFSLEEIKNAARKIFSAAVSAVNPAERLKEILRLDGDLLTVLPPDRPSRVFDLREFASVFLIGTGKASALMARAVEDIFRDRLAHGVITTKYGHGLPLRKTETVESGHPIPDRNGVAGAQRIQHLLSQTGPKDLVLFLLSGGGSALLPSPADGIRLEEKQKVTQLLLDCGADIGEINTVRKHISRIKGGWLARSAHPSTVLSLVLSDVVGDLLDVIASGPTVPDPSTFEDAWAILAKYELIGQVPPAVLDYLQRGREGKVEETPKPGDRAFEKVDNVLIGSNILALLAAEREAQVCGFNTLILSSSIVGETRESARFHAALAKEVISSGNPIGRPACLISGGETTVTIRGNGLGGRNLEFALAGALEIEGLAQTVLLSGGTDGTDGPTDAAGALADHTTCSRARDLGSDPKAHLEKNDAYPLFKKLGDLLVTGPTQTNVMDVRLLLID
jgi:glycerate 2-kinase